MERLKWCIQQKKGISLIVPDKEMKRAYILKAQEALMTMHSSLSKEWQMIAAYYTIYHALYSLLMEIGIKSEIHSCTIEFVKCFFNKHFSAKELTFIDQTFAARIDAQYYVNKNISDKKYHLILNNVPVFLVKCKNIILEQKDINEIREKILGTF